MSFSDDVRPLWQSPPAIYRGAPFWSWNDRMEPDRLRRQIRSMRQAGMGGFFMHSRYGLKTPYLSKEWFECIQACLDEADELGMKAYLYDEDRWPSGTAGGSVTRDHPEFAAQHLQMLPPEESSEDDRVALFAVERDASGAVVSYEALEQRPDDPDADGRTLLAFDVGQARPTGWHNDGPWVDSLNPEAITEFLHLTHQAYADRCGGTFGELIPAIFTDEPNFRPKPPGDAPAVPWTSVLARAFVQRRGYDLRDHLPELMLPLAGEAYSKPRADYYRTVTELFVEAFSTQIGTWCERHNIALTGHLLAEGTLRSQKYCVGACMPHYPHMQWPGIDVLRDQADELATAKQCASVADQFGKERVLTELYGCTGWDWPLSGHKFIGDWQYACGVNFRCPHLTHYSLAGGAKRDYPASIRDHSPWWAHYGAVEDYFARLGVMLTQGTPVRDVLVIHPIESAWGLGAGKDKTLDDLDDALARIIRLLSDQHYDWDFGDESILAEHAKVTKKGLQVGRMTYRLVIVPPCLTLRSTTVALLEKLTRQADSVLYVGSVPERIDGITLDTQDPPSAQPIAGANHCADAPDRLVGALEDLIPRRVSITQPGAIEQAEGIWTMLRSVKGGGILFLQSHHRQTSRRVTVDVQGRTPVVLWDPLSGRQTRLQAEAGEGRVTFPLELPPAGSALLTLGVPNRQARKPAPEPGEMETFPLEGPYPIKRTEPNTMPLDYCRFRLGDEQWSEPMPTLRADERIRAAFGLRPRENRGHQPWYLYGKGVIDTTPRGPCQMSYRFDVTDVPAACKLGIERPEDVRIAVNGTDAPAPDGFWVDEDIRTVDIAHLLKPGDNEVTLSFDYRPDMELEDLYLIGEFATACQDAGPPRPGAMTLVSPPETLSVGTWLDQGLHFYTGAVKYRITVAKSSPSTRVRVVLPDAACTAAVIHAGGKAFVLPWAPFSADVTDALSDGDNEVWVEIIGGRKNILGPLHTPWRAWTGPGEFMPWHEEWTDEYQLTPHGLRAPIVIESAR